MDCSTPGFPVHHQLPGLTQTCPLSRWCHPTISSSVVPFSFCLQPFPALGSFPRSQLFTSGGQSIGDSASVLPTSGEEAALYMQPALLTPYLCIWFFLPRRNWDTWIQTYLKKKEKPSYSFWRFKHFPSILDCLPKGSSFSPHTGRETREWCHFQRGHRCDRWEATPRWEKFLRAHPAQQRHPRHALLSGRNFWACGTCYQVRPFSV